MAGAIRPLPGSSERGLGDLGGPRTAQGRLTNPCSGNAKLRAKRGIGFEDIVFHIERGDLLDIVKHLNPAPVMPASAPSVASSTSTVVAVRRRIACTVRRFCR
jgi:hypothetical protein